MAIVASLTVLGVVPTLPGAFIQRGVLNVTGLAAGTSNTVPHGLLHPPQLVGVNSWGTGTGNVALNSSLGVVDAQGNHQGWDATNVYIITSAGTTSCQLTVEYGRL
jgi:hypothetical protein